MPFKPHPDAYLRALHLERYVSIFGAEPRSADGRAIYFNSATADGDCTVVGSDCLLMAYSHVAHDCVLGNQVVLANCGTLAGHVTVEDQVIFGGLAGAHQFVRIGRLSMIGGCSKVIQDVPPFMMGTGIPFEVRGLNSVGLKRRGIDTDARKLLKDAFRLLYREGLTTAKALERIGEELPAQSEIQYLVSFIKNSERGAAK